MNLSDPNFQLELAANIAVAGSILLAGRNNVHTWRLGIVGCALFAAVFERSHLYADMVLQFFFIAISVLGWWQWLRGDHGAPLPITALRPRAWAWLAPLAVVATFGYGWMLTRLTNAYAPYIDSAVLVLSVIAQILMMRRKLESWWVWLLVNTVAVPLVLQPWPAPDLDPVRGLLDQCAGGPAPLAAPDARRGQGGRCRCLSALRAAW